MTGALTEVPGVGPAAAAKLSGDPSEPITNTWMLFGKYFMMKGPDSVDEDGNHVAVGCAMHNDRFWYWLKDKGISAHRSAICKAIAEKVGACAIITRRQ